MTLKLIYTVMVENSNNINKTNNHLSTTEHKKITIYGIENSGLGLTWDRHKNVAGLNRLMGSQPGSSDN